MSVYKACFLYCSVCARQFGEPDESARDVRASAKEAGWVYVKVANGSYWDKCSECKDKEDEE